MPEQFDFSEALKRLKQGGRLRRAGWNDPNQFVVRQKGYPKGIDCNKQTAEAFGYVEGYTFRVAPYLQIRATDGVHYMWTPSSADLFANDWIQIYD